MKALIWDMDGVIADTFLYYLKGWQMVLQKRGVNYTEEDLREADLIIDTLEKITIDDLGRLLNQYK